MAERDSDITLGADCIECQGWHELHHDPVQHGWRMYCGECGMIGAERSQIVAALRFALERHAPNREDTFRQALLAAYRALLDAADRLDSDEDPHGARIAREAAEAAFKPVGEQFDEHAP